ncbi:MAG: peptidoglycan DD-metalloendopeptidase family protein [Alphaproteobacteria bacterium]|nr:peptidoglycan DD-metalloendopeptidase family protein [Alphaproteobacteria bacterium]
MTPEWIKNFAGCWECNLLEIVFTQMFTVAERMYKIITPAATTAVIVAFAFWFLWYVWENVIFAKSSTGKMAEDVMKKLVAFAFVLGMMSLPAMTIFNWTAGIAMEGGAALSKHILERTMANVNLAEHYGGMTGRNTENLYQKMEEPKKLAEPDGSRPDERTLYNLMVITNAFAKSYQLGFDVGFKVAFSGAAGVLGTMGVQAAADSTFVNVLRVSLQVAIRSATITAFSAGGTFAGPAGTAVGAKAGAWIGSAVSAVVDFIIGLVITISLMFSYLANGLVLVMGIGIVAAFAYVAFYYLTTLFDIIIKLAMIVIMMPIILAAWMFENTRSKISVPMFFTFGKCAFRIVFLSIAVSISIFLFDSIMNYRFGGDDIGLNVGEFNDVLNDAEGIEIDPAALDGLELGFPFAGNYPVSSAFGWRVHPVSGEWREHRGTDFAMPMGTTLIAAESGTVVRAGLGGETIGMVVEIRHNDKISTVYGHLSRTLVKVGDTVNRGDRIALSGGAHSCVGEDAKIYCKDGVDARVGQSSGAHLHYEVRLNNKSMPISVGESLISLNPANNFGLLIKLFTHIGIVVAMIFVAMAAFMLLGAANSMGDEMASKLGAGGMDDDTVLDRLRSLVKSALNYIKSGVIGATRQVRYLSRRDIESDGAEESPGRAGKRAMRAAMDLPLEDKIKLYRQQQSEPGAEISEGGGKRKYNLSLDAGDSHELERLDKKLHPKIDMAQRFMQSSRTYSNATDDKRDVMLDLAFDYGWTDGKYTEHVADDDKKLARDIDAEIRGGRVPSEAIYKPAAGLFEAGIAQHTGAPIDDDDRPLAIVKRKVANEDAAENLKAVGREDLARALKSNRVDIAAGDKERQIIDKTIKDSSDSIQRDMEQRRKLREVDKAYKKIQREIQAEERDDGEDRIIIDPRILLDDLYDRKREALEAKLVDPELSFVEKTFARRGLVKLGKAQMAAEEMDSEDIGFAIEKEIRAFNKMKPRAHNPK